MTLPALHLPTGPGAPDPTSGLGFPVCVKAEKCLMRWGDWHPEGLLAQTAGPILPTAALCPQGPDLPSLGLFPLGVRPPPAPALGHEQLCLTGMRSWPSWTGR